MHSIGSEGLCICTPAQQNSMAQHSNGQVCNKKTLHLLRDQAKLCDGMELIIMTCRDASTQRATPLNGIQHGNTVVGNFGPLYTRRPSGGRFVSRPSTPKPRRSVPRSEPNKSALVQYFDPNPGGRVSSQSSGSDRKSTEPPAQPVNCPQDDCTFVVRRPLIVLLTPNRMSIWLR